MTVPARSTRGPNGTALALGGHGQRAGTASAVMGMAMFAVGGIGIPVIAALAGTSAISMTAVIAIGATVAALLGLVIVRRVAPPV